MTDLSSARRQPLVRRVSVLLPFLVLLVGMPAVEAQRPVPASAPPPHLLQTPWIG